MTETITYHTFLEAIGIITVAALFLYPVLGVVWDVSAEKARREFSGPAREETPPGDASK